MTRQQQINFNVVLMNQAEHKKKVQHTHIFGSLVVRDVMSEKTKENIFNVSQSWNNSSQSVRKVCWLNVSSKAVGVLR